MNGIANNMRVLDAKLDAKRQVLQHTANNAAAASFKDVLGSAIEQQEGLQFSKHANMRLDARQIRLTGDQLERVENGVSKANEKGIRDSLVLVDNVALVVNVKSKTVITAMNRDNESVFSNIDGAVIV